MGLLDLLREDKINPKYTSSTYGGEYASPCPGCGGKDRFKTWPNHPEGENWWCRQCGKGGSVVHYLVHFRNMNYHEACESLGIAPSSFRRRAYSRPWTPQPVANAPSEKWQQQTLDLLRITQDILWRPSYVKVKEWLNKDRLLSDGTIRKAGLGWLPKDLFLEREPWGLPDKLDDKGVKKKLWIPAGLVIPCFSDNMMQRIRVRRLNPPDDMKYYIVPGSSTAPMMIGTSNMIILVESELDAILLAQEAGDLVSVIALGSSEKRPDEELYQRLKKAERILVSLDTDEAGAKSSWRFWMEQFPRAVRWPVIKGKDPTEASLNGFDLRKWAVAGIRHERGQRSLSVIEGKEITCPILSAEHVKNLADSKELGIHMLLSDQDGVECIFLSAPDHPMVHVNASGLEDHEQLAALKQILESPSEKILYDAKSSIKGLDKLGIPLQGPLFDVKLAQQVLSAGIEEKDNSLTGLLRKYNILDTPVSLPEMEAGLLPSLKNVLSRELEASQLTSTARLEFDCIRATAEMEKNGFLLYRKKLEAGRTIFSKRKEELEHDLHVELGEINLNSSPKVIDALSARGITLKSINEDTILEHLDDHPLVKSLHEYRKITRTISIIDNLLCHMNSETGRVHPQYEQIGAPTGRFSCSNPPLHAIPKGSFRAYFIASPGHKLVIADYSQIELRVLAEITQDERMIDAFMKGEDLHKLTASVITGIPLEQVTSKERQAAKAVNFGLIYGMGATGLRNYAHSKYEVSMSLEHSYRFIQRYFDFYKGVNEWQQRIKQNSTLETRTILGRRRLWTDKPKITELLNSPIQGTAADIIKEALVILTRETENTVYKIVGCFHDEVVLEVPDTAIEWAEIFLTQSMVEAGSKYLKSIPIIVNTRIADNWSEK